MDELKYETVQEHEYQDIYRLCYGVLVIVNKYNIANYNWYWGNTKEHKKKLEKIKGLKSCFKTLDDIDMYTYNNQELSVLPRGSIIFEDNVIIPTNNKDEYFYELKTTGSCFSGVGKEFSDLLNLVKEIYDK